MGKFLTDVDLNQNELQYAVIQNLNTDPIVSTTGQIYYNANISKLRLKTSAGWVTISTGTITIPTLQQVTTVGNTTTNSIVIDSTGVGTQGFRITDNPQSIVDLYAYGLYITSQSLVQSAFVQGALTLGDLNQDITNPVNLSLVNDTISYGVGLLLNSSAIIQDISLIYHPDYFIPQVPANSPSIFYIPYKLEGTYTLATLDDIPSYTIPTLQEVTTAGNTTLDDIRVNSVGLWGNAFGDYGYLSWNDTGLSFKDHTTLELFNVNKLDNSLLFINNNNLVAKVDSGLLTGNRLYQYPDNNGIIALLSDIPTYNVPTLQQVLSTGNTALTNIELSNSSVTVDNNNGIVVTTFGKLENDKLTMSSTSGTFTSVLNSNSLKFTSGLTSSKTFNAGIYGAIQTYQLPAKAAGTYTLATTIDIPTVGTWGALNYPTWTAGTPFVKMTAAGTFTLDTNTYLTSAVTSVGATSPITSSGGNTPTISTSMATNKLIGRSTAGTGVMEEIAIGTGLTLTGGTLNASATGGIQHATASGTDTYTATIAGVTSYSDADAYLIRFTNGNTTSATLNINSLGAIPLYRNNDGPLLGGDVVSGGEMLCVYNSSLNIFQCIGTAPNSLFAYVTNDDSVTITKGMPVYAFGGTGDRMTVKRANNTGDATSAQTVGLVLSTSIAANQKGFILMQGLLDGLSILPTATWSDGDAVYLGATAGTITNVKPYAPNHLVYLGIVTTASNGSAGRLYVRVQNGYELQELHNVDLISNTPTNNQLLTYESATSLWKNKNLTDILETFNRTQGIYFFDDFMGNLVANITNTTNGFVTSIGNGQGTLRTTSTINNRTNQQGVVEALTNANATGTAGYYYSGGVYKGSGAISIETSLNFTTLSVLAERFFSLFGFYTGANYFNPPNCIAITYDEGGSTIPFAGGTPNFRCITKGGSTVTNTITSVPVVAGQWYRLRINISNDGNTVTFFIDNALVATHTTNIPLNATFLPLGSMLQKTSGVAARAMQTDYFMYKEIFTTAR